MSLLLPPLLVSGFRGQADQAVTTVEFPVTLCVKRLIKPLRWSRRRKLSTCSGHMSSMRAAALGLPTRQLLVEDQTQSEFLLLPTSFTMTCLVGNSAAWTVVKLARKSQT